MFLNGLSVSPLHLKLKGQVKDVKMPKSFFGHKFNSATYGPIYFEHKAQLSQV